jgi:hypothetical protein
MSRRLFYRAPKWLRMQKCLIRPASVYTKDQGTKEPVQLLLPILEIERWQKS